ncbi:MAG: hypothetical protein RIS45_603, partial [Planctomycetota bacterium]
MRGGGRRTRLGQNAVSPRKGDLRVKSGAYFSHRMRRSLTTAPLLASTLLLAPAAAAAGAGDRPNILVVVLDDLGIDQMAFPPFGWNAAPEAPSMPVLAEIA